MSKGKEKLQAGSIAKKYTKGKDLGEGGNAEVFESINVATGERVALKTLSFWNSEKEERFQAR